MKQCKYIISVFPLLLLVVFATTILYCTSHLKDTTTIFKSNFETIDAQTWIGAEYGSNLEKDWQINNNRLECLVSHGNRKIHLLAYKLNKDISVLETVVRVGFYNQEITNSNKNWAGFCIGTKNGSLDKVGNPPNTKYGINIGVCTNGALFIGDSSPKNKNNEVMEKLKKGVDLKVLITHKHNAYTIDFSVLEIDSGKELAHISRKGLVVEQLTGHLALVSNFENAEQTTIPQKSVWFKDWILKDSKPKRLRDRHV